VVVVVVGARVLEVEELIVDVVASLVTYCVVDVEGFELLGLVSTSTTKFECEVFIIHRYTN
jgi:hypothetical protein